MIDREKTGPDKISSRAIQVIRQTLTDGFCPGTTPGNFQRYQRLFWSSYPSSDQYHFPSPEEIGGKLDLESGPISKGGIFSVVHKENRAAVEKALIERITLFQNGLLDYPEDCFWSLQTLTYAGSDFHIVRTTSEGGIQILQINESDDKEELIEVVGAKNLRRVARLGTGQYKVGNVGDLLYYAGEQQFLPQVRVSDLLAGQTVAGVSIMGAPHYSAITDVVVIGPNNQLLERTIDWSNLSNRYKTYS